MYDFARQLRALRSNAQLTYRRMAEIMHHSASTFARAANGRALPPLDVTVAYVTACGGDTEHWRRLWQTLARKPDEAPDGAAPAGPNGGVSRPHQLVPDIADFVGRAEQLAGAARALAGGAHLVAVTGPPGVGKTAFAVRLAHQVRTWFPDGQLYLQLRGFGSDRQPPAAALAQLLRGLGEPAGAIPADVNESAALYRSRLADRRCLVVLDDAHDEVQIRPLLASRPCAVVVTSRNVLAGLESACRVALDMLGEAEALEMLARISGRRRVFDNVREAQTVTRLCGRLPLAIRIAGARLVTRPSWTVADLTARLHAERDRLNELSVGDLAVRAAFERSYRCLEVDHRVLFRRLALLPGARFSARTVEVLSGAGPKADVALQRLVDANLVAVASAGEYYAMHDLLRLFAGECARVDDDTTRKRTWRRVAMWYARSAAGACDATRHLPRLLAWPAPGNQAHLELDDERAAFRWLDTERANLVSTVRIAARTGPRPASWLIVDAMRGFFYHARHIEDWRAVTEAGLAAALAARDRRATVAMLIGRGEAEAASGDYLGAVGHHLRALATSRRIGWPQGEAVTLSVLGAAYACLGRLDAARRCHTRALDISRSAGDRGGEGVALANLAGLHREAGDIEEARHLYIRALWIHQARGDRLGTAMVLSMLAHTYRDLDRLADSASSCYRAQAIWSELGSRYGQALALLGLAAVEIEAGRCELGRSHAARALRIGRETGDRRLRVDALNMWGAAQTRSGRPGVAVRIHGVALRHARRVGLTGGIVDALLGLGEAYLALGLHQLARDHGEAALDRAREHGIGWAEGPALTVLAEAHLGLADPTGAGEYARQGLVALRPGGRSYHRGRLQRVVG